MLSLKWSHRRGSVVRHLASEPEVLGSIPALSYVSGGFSSTHWVRIPGWAASLPRLTLNHAKRRERTNPARRLREASLEPWTFGVPAQRSTLRPRLPSHNLMK